MKLLETHSNSGEILSVLNIRGNFQCISTPSTPGKQCIFSRKKKDREYTRANVKGHLIGTGRVRL